MGQVILEIPQNVNRTFRIESEKKATEILEQLEDSNERLSKFERAVASGRFNCQHTTIGAKPVMRF
ncbi:MAG: hypothetical protein H0X49_04475 [Acidobacteria bacterium]|jgi:uncharacterized protein involved in exopolysaccharide biosynthesis|nr:hypothetical protein [Acidobacteriota bacterium]